MRQNNPVPMRDLGFQRAPAPLPLRPWVRWFWSLSCNPGSYQARTEYIHPDGGSGLVFNWEATTGEYPGYYHAGVNLDPVSLQSRPRIMQGKLNTFGVLLKPGALYALGGIPVSELAAFEALPQPLRSALDQLSHQLFAASDFHQRVAIAEVWLRHRFTDAHTPFVEQLARNPDNSGYSKRHVERLCRSQLGLSPRQLQLLDQVNLARGLIKQSPHTPLTEIALTSGFYDQAHFIHRFRSVLGISPGEFRTRFLHKQTELALREFED